MSFQPLVAQGGYLGWRLLTRTLETQKAILAKTTAVQRVHADLSQRLPQHDTAESLVADRRSLAPVLTAYGLEGEVKNRALIRKILEQGTSERTALANRMADKRYAAFARNMGFDGKKPATTQAGFADKIFNQYVDREFERLVGERDQNLRLALNARRELSDMAGRASTENTKWYEVLGNPPLRKVFEGAFALPSSFAKLPIDRQVSEMKDRHEKMFGSGGMAVFKNDDAVEKLIRNFLIRSQVAQGRAASGYSVALQLLSR